jgi:hypothetical protein
MPEAELGEALSILAYRLADDLRAFELLLQRNYRAQAMTIAASAMEGALTLRYIGLDVARAATWTAHTSLDRAPWPVRKLIREADSQGAAINAVVYSFLSAAKHHNPKILRGMVKARSLDQHRIDSDALVETGLVVAIRLLASMTIGVVYSTAEWLAASGRLSPKWVQLYGRVERTNRSLIVAFYDVILAIIKKKGAA